MARHIWEQLDVPGWDGKCKTQNRNLQKEINKFEAVFKTVAPVKFHPCEILELANLDMVPILFH